MTDKKFRAEYIKSVDSAELPSGYKDKILSALKEQEKLVTFEAERIKYSKNKVRLVSSLVAAVLIIAVGLSVIFSMGINNSLTKEVSFYVASATNLKGIAGARIVFKTSAGELLKDENGEILTAVTDETGEALTVIPDNEEYTAQISAQGYITIEQSAQEGNVYVSPVMNEDTYRAVLTWSKDWDLDAHLSVTSGDDTEKLNYFNSDIEDAQGNVLAALDTDSDKGGSPETITFNARENMCLRFSVASYSSLKEGDNTKLSYSGAKVTLYRGERLVGTYSIDTASQGNVWCVFEIEDSQLKICDYTYSVSAMTEIK